MDELYMYHYERTGHLMLHTSDFGWWSCRACDKHGDDFDNPKDFECVGNVGIYEI